MFPSHDSDLISVQSPAKNILVENIYCNWSGGCAMGSLSTDVDISDVLYRNVYTWSSNQMFMIKSNGGSGTVSNLALENFIGTPNCLPKPISTQLDTNHLLGHGNAYSLDIDQQWSSMSTVDGDGVQLKNITIKNWKGTEADGAQRGPIKVNCAADAPCTDVTIEDFAMWTESGSYQKETCNNAYGSGSCLKSGSGGSYSTTVTETTAPTGYSAATMAANLKTAFGTVSSIPIPTIPTSFYPGATPISALAGAQATSSSEVRAQAISSSSSEVKAQTTSSSDVKAQATSSSEFGTHKHSSSDSHEHSSPEVETCLFRG
jgi:rhamnogalacturonan hydrolase